MTRSLFSCLALISLTTPFASSSPSPEALATIVVFNKADPESQALAKYYASLREIPENHLIGLDCPLSEEISRAEYELTIHLPLRAELFTKGLWSGPGDESLPTSTKIRFIALIRGIPLKIRPEPAIPPTPLQPPEIGSRNEASVDSELAQISNLRPQTPGLIQNPLFRSFTRALDLQNMPFILMVTRLDAPDASTVRTIIDFAIAAERDGLQGWALIDERGLSDSPLEEGDRWLRTTADSLRKKGIPVLIDRGPDVLPAGFPIDQVAIYFGWYEANLTGALATPEVKFRPGAIAAHIHSFSASTLRSHAEGWCGPLLSRGATATLGNVYEPYLLLTHDIAIFQDRLMAGLTFAESAFYALRAISWMNVAIGDPLYRPFSKWLQPHTQTTPTSWETYRKIILDHTGNILIAAQPLRNAAKKFRNPIFLEALAAAQLDEGLHDEALKTLDEAQSIENSPSRTARLTWLDFSKNLALGHRETATRALERLQNAGPHFATLAEAMNTKLNPPNPNSSPPQPSPGQ